ncbi:Trehalose-phosphate phosphatase [Microbacterium lemovicicum]|uniref:Trehalose 6-phosphate phosphatase n=1 Tax=Microbacterium lemovicicum TaxID=1072463 RepID=A0A3S9WAM1_9MICO|nr:trehalose-phosphatase [Microbacterium lemovicicum]AZS37097.1 Trehalose-phosphate phosphatase [Microbacterium lemovicicum]
MTPHDSDTTLEADTLAALERIAGTDVLLVALDFDGTLSLLQKEPMKARMLPEARAAVDALAALPRTVVALVSGRTIEDLAVISEHADDSPIDMAGSHGAEFLIAGERIAVAEEDPAAVALRDELRSRAEGELADLDGVWVEPKTYGFGVHTRAASDDDAARALETADAMVAERAPEWRRRTGHSIVEYSFRQEGKDAALRVLRERLSATAVLFAGDDTTDEDALGSLTGDDLGIRVGEGDTAAAVRVPDAATLSSALAVLARLRAVATAEAAPARE